MQRRLLTRVALAALVLYAAGVSFALYDQLAKTERERRRVAHVVQMLALAKFWLRNTPVNLDRLPPGYDRISIEDSTPYWRSDAKQMILLSPPQPPPEARLESALHFSSLVFDGDYAVYVGERGRFVDVEWSKP